MTSACSPSCGVGGNGGATSASFEDELGIYAEISSSASWSTPTPSSPPLEEHPYDESEADSAAKALLDETALVDSDDENDVPTSNLALELSQDSGEGCTTVLAPSCPTLEGLLCGGNYGMDDAASTSLPLQRHVHHHVHRHALEWLDDEEAVDEMPPLPLFFTTRFKTLDAERSAQPPGTSTTITGDPHNNTVTDPCYSDWYDMFAWLTLGGSNSNNTTASNAPQHLFLPWNGHLSLGPEHPSLARRIRRKRRHNIATIMPKQKASSSLFHPIHQQQDNSQQPPQQIPRILRPLPIIPVNQPGHEDWEMIFLSNDDQSPSSDAKGKHGIRRPPTATTSMSIPQGVSPSNKKDTHSGKHSKKGAAGMDLDTIAVRTPGADRSALKELPALRDAPPTKREELFILKLKLCSVIFSFDDPTADKRGKDMKRQTLLELVDYVNTPAGQKIFTESVMSDLMAMVSANVCRALPPATDDFDPEEDEPVLEPAWPHLQVAYEFFLRFIVSSEVNAKAAKKYVDQKFCLQLVELFDSEDPRERDYLKTILHRIYGKFMSHRSFIRRAISNVFYRFVYETERHNGIGELLEILGSIINGFAIPLKKEHLQFLVRALIPLHKPKCVALYHQQLSYCIIQYVEKDADTATPILNGFFKCWPWSSSAKQVMFLNELEEILELLGADQLAQVSTMLFTNLARCLDSDHFQVVERALFLWNNEHLVNSGCLSRLNAQTVLPIIYRPLYKNSAGHWNATVEGLAQNVLKMYMEYDLVLYDKCAKAYYREEEEAKRKLEALEAQWSAVEQTAAANMPALMAK